MDKNGGEPSIQGIGLADAVDAVRAELGDAMRRGQGQPIQFPVGSIQLEFQIGITREGGGSAGFRIWVLDLEAHGSVASECVQKVTLSLDPPVDASGERVKVKRALDERP